MSVLTDIGSAVKTVVSGLNPTSVVSDVIKLADKLIPDKGKRDEFQHELDVITTTAVTKHQEAMDAINQKLIDGEVAIQTAQLEAAKQDSQSNDSYVRHWRPTAMYLMMGLLFFAIIVAPILQAKLPGYTFTYGELLIGCSMTLLGGGVAARSWEKGKGISK